jgi:hypothetical protein
MKPRCIFFETIFAPAFIIYLFMHTAMHYAMHCPRAHIRADGRDAYNIFIAAIIYYLI